MKRNTTNFTKLTQNLPWRATKLDIIVAIDKPLSLVIFFFTPCKLAANVINLSTTVPLKCQNTEHLVTCIPSNRPVLWNVSTNFGRHKFYFSQYPLIFQGQYGNICQKCWSTRKCFSITNCCCPIHQSVRKKDWRKR